MSASTPTKRRLELWMALLREGEYTHMVYDLTRLLSGARS